MSTFEAAMAQNQRLAGLSEMLPDTAGPRRGWRALIPRLRRPEGLEVIPERYRLQFLLLASDAMPGASPAQVAEIAGRLATQTRIPKRLLAKDSGTPDLDRWFRDSSERIRGRLDELLEAQTR